MKLVIAEKPSVAQSIARVIGAAGRKDGYLEGNGYLVSWCVGHLVELSAPETYDERYSKWRLEDLPILPENWLYQVSSGTKKQFGILKELMKRPDVESLICATDAGREGELIFRLVYNQCHCKKPFKRLWIWWMTRYEEAPMSNRIRIYTKVTPEELARIKEKMSEVDVRNRSAYLRKMALDGYCVNMDFSDIRELVSLLRRCSNNLNQYAKKANETGSIYAEDIRDLQTRLDEIWEGAKEIMARLAAIS